MIADLYNGNAVVVGQAAALFAPANTPLPNLATINQADPFSMAPWTTAVINGAVAPVTAFTLTYKGATTSSLNVTALTAAAIQAALGALATVGVGNVSVGGTAATGWTVSFSEAVQGGSLTISPTGGTATIQTPLWTPCGATDAGWTFATNKSTTDTTIEEQSPPVGTTITSQKVAIEGALAEDITKTLALAYNGLVTTVVAASGIPGYEEINPTDDVIVYAVALIMKQFNGKPRLVYAPQWTQLSNVSTAMRRASAKRMYPVAFNTICATSQIRIINLLTAALP
jgi:hypothetical protein